MPGENWRPVQFMSPDTLIILTYGTCGSTCATFTKILQEDNKATFIGFGGVWSEQIDIASFAGGFVSNPDYSFKIATWSGVTFPQFLTNQQ